MAPARITKMKSGDKKNGSNNRHKINFMTMSTEMELLLMEQALEIQRSKEIVKDLFTGIDAKHRDEEIKKLDQQYQSIMQTIRNNG